MVLQILGDGGLARTFCWENVSIYMVLVGIVALGNEDSHVHPHIPMSMMSIWSKMSLVAIENGRSG